MIVGFAAGGGNDIFARLVGAKLSEIIGQAVVIENKPSAGGGFAAEYVAQQTPDGYTLLVAASGMMSIAGAIYSDLKYDPVKSFTPLAMIANFPLIFVVAGDHPANTVKELVEWAKAHPDKANYPSTSPSFTITSELFKLKSGMPGVISLQGQQRNDPRRHRRPVAVRFSGRPADGAAGQGRQIKSARRDRRRTLVAIAGYAEHERSWLSRCRRAFVERLLRRPARRRRSRPSFRRH